MDEASWRSIIQVYNSTIINMDTALERLAKLAQLARSDFRLEEITNLQQLLKLGHEKTYLGEAKLPCVVLPSVRNTRHWDRVDILSQIEDYFTSEDSNDERPLGIALYGLGGVGKSHVALKYAHSKVKDLDAVLWIYGETETSLAQSFTDIAIALQLPDANPQHHAENRILVLSWLQRTCKSIKLIL
jgi:hypothetical protein